MTTVTNVGRKTYPIYRVRMVHKDPAKTRSFHDKIFHDEAEADAYFAKNQNHFVDAVVRKGKDPSEFKFEVTLRYRETWCMEWFCHATLRDRFDNPGAVLADFEDYVYRIERMQGSEMLSHESMRLYTEETGRPWIVLMGAFDRWRWRGDGEGSPPPCKCEHCANAGLWRILH